MGTESEGRSWGRSVASFAAVAGVCGLLGACGRGMDAIDRRTDRLVAERAAAVGSPVAPKTSKPDPQGFSRAGQARKRPPTVNPPPERVAIDPADPDRDVQDRLRRFTAESAGLGSQGDAGLALTLPEALAIAQRSAPEFLNAEEEFILAAIRLLLERRQWDPRFFNDTTVSVTGQGDDGDFQSALNVVNDLRVTKRLPYGGSVEAAWVWRAVEQLRSEATEGYRQSSEIVLSGRVPLLRGAGVVAQESLIQSERSLIYQARAFEQFRREFLVSIARDYFDLLQTQAQIANQKRRLASLRQLEAQTKAKVDAGRAQRFDLGIAENDVLNSVSALAALRDGFIVQLDTFKIRLGLPTDEPVVIENLVFDLSEPDISLIEATARAMEYRLDLQNQRDRLDDARRGIRIARNQLLPDLDASASVGLPTDPDERVGGVGFSPGDLNYAAGVTFGLPIDREDERLRLRSAIIGLEQQTRETGVFEDRVVLAVRAAVRAIDLARFQLRLAEQQVVINELRQEQQRIQAETTTSQQRVETEDALLNALNARDAALTRLRTAVLDFLLVTGQLRVGRDGQLAPVAGMEVRPIRLFEDIDGLERWYEDPPPYEPAERPLPEDE